MEENQRRAEAEATDALNTFRDQMDTVLCLLINIARDIEDLRDSVKAAKEYMSAGVSKGPLQPNDLRELSVTLDRVNEALIGIVEKADPLTQAHPYIFDWMLVMTVTYTEAYLENALLLLVNACPVVMRSKEKMWVTAEEVSQLDTAGDAKQQLDKIREATRKRWAKAFLNDKPSTWIAKLTKMGVSTFGPTLASDMNRIWTRRHELVHAPPPRLDKHGAKKHMCASRVLFEQAVRIAYGFVDATDLYIVKVLRQSGTSRSA